MARWAVMYMPSFLMVVAKESDFAVKRPLVKEEAK